jgi:hypothetical protein
LSLGGDIGPPAEGAVLAADEIWSLRVGLLENGHGAFASATVALRAEGSDLLVSSR